LQLPGCVLRTGIDVTADRQATKGGDNTAIEVAETLIGDRRSGGRSAGDRAGGDIAAFDHQTHRANRTAIATDYGNHVPATGEVTLDQVSGAGNRRDGRATRGDHGAGGNAGTSAVPRRLVARRLPVHAEVEAREVRREID